MSLEDWWEAGARRRLMVGGEEREVFAVRTGSGPQLTLLHGFPSSSHDWAKIAPALAARHSLLAPDFLGFGASEKPADHTYSIGEQADLVEALWAAEGIERTALVAHDYAVSVTEELLARRGEGALRVDLTSITFLNGGLYPDLHRPEPGQLALLDPEQGPALVELIDENLFTMSMAPTFAEGFDAAADSAAIWQATSRDDGHRLLHRLIRYIPDRVANADRWTGALEATDVPVAFAWGMLDPVSGAHMAERIRNRLPEAPFLALDATAHWPQLEAPERVAEAILTPVEGERG
jgi:pimeloyl-ACP methyl ester carboxylesterase